MPTGSSQPRKDPAPSGATQRTEAWNLVLLNDPVNRMSYVVMVLRRVFGFDEDEARHLMLSVHEHGRAIIWTGTREQAEAHMFALHQWHLTAKIEAERGS